MVLDEIASDHDGGDLSLVHGACHIDYCDIAEAWSDRREPKYLKELGADYYADLWARERGIPQNRYPALWHKYGKAAGPKRNYTMFWSSLPNMCVAFKGAKGTEGMKKICYNAGIEVFDVPTCSITQK